MGNNYSFKIIYSKYIYLLIITSLVLSCHGKVEKQNSSGYNTEDSLKIKILNGDTIAYLHLRDIMVDKDYAPEFLTWALIMSNKYHYSVANYDVYFCLQQIDAYYNKKSTSSSLDMLDSTTRMLAISYLRKFGDEDSLVEELTKRYVNTK